jgi:hypothetical protein
MSETYKITKVKKDSDRRIVDVMLNDGLIIPLNHAILLAKDGKIEGVNVVRGKDGGEFLRGDPNNTTEDNLANLPGFK